MFRPFNANNLQENTFQAKQHSGIFQLTTVLCEEDFEYTTRIFQSLDQFVKNIHQNHLILFAART